MSNEQNRTGQVSAGVQPEASPATVLQCVAVVAACIALIPVGIVGLVQRRLAYQTATEAALKQSLTERGMDAKEIERVLRASASGDESGRTVNCYTLGIAKDQIELSKYLADRGYPGDEIERIVSASSGDVEATGGASAQAAQRARTEVARKRELVRGGPSGEPIERVLRGPTRHGGDQAAGPAEKTRQADIEAAIAELGQRGEFTAARIERDLREAPPVMPRVP
jgi:hypothetical protein